MRFPGDKPGKEQAPHSPRRSVYDGSVSVLSFKTVTEYLLLSLLGFIDRISRHCINVLFFVLVELAVLADLVVFVPANHVFYRW